ncbi:unnamed protein product [Mytilus coruscus]|uniref:Uncharacterized protein n=1 Tax=Mytilus coruscus TaxID=42192 RepID=A0A6J8AP69_MYTCO|nr:unnamed protein product [Mytilus coruscus]
MIAEIPELEAHKKGRDTLLAFKKDIGTALLQAANYSEAIILAKVAMIDHKSGFSRTFHEGYVESAIPSTLLQKRLFTTAAMENIYHNPTITTATTSFHGTSISLFQHPSADNAVEKRESIHIKDSKAIDQAHNQANGVTKGDGGAICVTEDPSALRRWKVAEPKVSHNFANQYPPTIDAEDHYILERFVVAMYDRFSDIYKIDKARLELFVRKQRSYDSIPPTEVALIQHVRRAAYQAGCIWGQSTIYLMETESPSN